jgi:energy-converting hydrogenase Eha subunit H
MTLTGVAHFEIKTQIDLSIDLIKIDSTLRVYFDVTEQKLTEVLTITNRLMNQTMMPTKMMWCMSIYLTSLGFQNIFLREFTYQ